MISNKEMIAAISSHEVFQDLGDDALLQLEEVAELKIFKKNEILFEIGDLPNFIFYLLSGSLTLQFPDKSKLNLEAGELIGEIGLLNGDFRLGRLVANSDCQLISLCGDKMFDPDYISSITSLTILRRLGKRVTNYLKSLQQTSTLEVIESGENEYVEFKSTMRWNIIAEKKDKRITHSILKTIAAFLNSNGGILMVGVDDKGEVLGLKEDRFENDDKMLLFITNNIKSHLGTLHLSNIHFCIEELKGLSILRVDIEAGDVPCYVEYDNSEYFYLRTGPATTELSVSKVYAYVNKRFYN